MSQERPVMDLSFRSTTDRSLDTPNTSSCRYRFVKFGAAGYASASTGNTDILAGVQKNLPIADQFMDVAVMGTSKVRAGGAINANSFVKHDNSTGKVIQGGAGSDVNCAFALEAAAADGDIIECIIFPLNKVTT